MAGWGQERREYGRAVEERAGEEREGDERAGEERAGTVGSSVGTALTN